MEEKSSQPVKLFYCYAREDRLLRDKLHTNLAILRRKGLITEWHDGEIIPGAIWKEEIKARLDAADVILLLISSDFLASDYCYSIELKRALERHEQGKARVIPIILRPVPDWQGTPFGKLQALPKDAKPVTIWGNQDEAFVNVVEGIRQIATEVLRSQHIAQRVEHTISSPKVHKTTQLVPTEQEKVSKRLDPTTVWAKIRGKDFPSSWHVLKVPSDLLASYLIGSFIGGAIIGAVFELMGLDGILFISHYILNIQILDFSTFPTSQQDSLILSLVILGAIAGSIYLCNKTSDSMKHTLVLMPDGFADFSHEGKAHHIISYKAVEDIRFDSVRGTLVVTITPLSLEVDIKNLSESPRLIAQHVEKAYTSFKARNSLP